MVMASKQFKRSSKRKNNKQKQNKSKKKRINRNSKKRINKNSKKRTKKNKLQKGGVLIDHQKDQILEEELTRYVFFDNDMENIKGIEEIENLTTVRVKEMEIQYGNYKLWQAQELEKLWQAQELEKFRAYLEANKENNKIYEIILENKNDVKVSQLYSYYDVNNSLTPDTLARIKDNVSRGQKYVFFWDWDRTLSMEEGFIAIHTPPLSESDFKYSEIFNQYHLYPEFDQYLKKYINDIHNKNTGVNKVMGLSPYSMEDGDFVKYLFGGEKRISALVELLKLPNIIHCIISNSAAFDLFNKINEKRKNVENILLVRSFFNDMGLSLEDQSRILILHCGSKTKDTTGYNKQSIINKAMEHIEKKKPIIIDTDISNLKLLMHHRINQIIKFMNKDDEPVGRTLSAPAGIPTFDEFNNNNLPRRTQSGPSTLTFDSIQSHSEDDDDDEDVQRIPT